jgi:hypothetical protein
VYDVFVQTSIGAEITPAISRFAARLEEVAGDQRVGLYLAGSPALGDLSPRQSNVDLVAVTERVMAPDLLRDLSRAHRPLRLHGRDAAVCYTTWDGLATSPEEADAAVFDGGERVEQDRLANPMTWAILAEHPVPIAGPGRPEVRSDPDQVRTWFSERLPGIAARMGHQLWRRHLTRVVLQATRCAHGAGTGEVVSLHRAGELALPTASHTGHRVITDALGYREGANTSMYWGPFERKSNAGTLAADLLRAVERPVPQA